MKKDVLEELVVVKRSGQRVNFNNYKIVVAIKNAFDSIYGEYDKKNINKVYEDVLKYIENNYTDRKTINVEDIQDIIENKLRECGFIDVYDSFNDYRQKRALSRKVFTIKAQHKFIKAMEKIANDNSLKGDNSLKPNEIIIKYGKTVANEFTKAYIMDNKYLRAHEEGNIFINDFEYFPLGIVRGAHPDFSNYLEKTNSINSLTDELINLQTEVNGEINVSGIDYLLENWLIRQYKYYYREFINNYTKVIGVSNYINLRKIEELIDKENAINDKIFEFKQFILSDQVEKAFKSAYEDTISKITEVLTWKINKMLTNLNIKQTSSLSISFGTNKSFAGTLINHAVLDVLEALPTLNNLTMIFKAKKSSYEIYIERVVDLILKNKKIEISFSDNSFNKSDYEVEYFASGARIFENTSDTTKISKGRLLIGETNINMCRLGLKYADGSIKEFYNELDELLELIKNELLLTFETIGNKNKDNYNILFNNNILDDEKLENAGKIRKVIKNGNLNIGLVGFKECIMVLAKEEEKEYGLIVEILNYLNKKCKEFTNETKLNFHICEPFNLIARRELLSLDKAVYGEIKGITNKGYYDLICELPSIKDDYKILAHVQKFFSGGSMYHIALPKNISAKRLADMINELMNADIGFVKFDIKGLEEKL